MEEKKEERDPETILDVGNLIITNEQDIQRKQAWERAAQKIVDMRKAAEKVLVEAKEKLAEVEKRSKPIKLSKDALSPEEQGLLADIEKFNIGAGFDNVEYLLNLFEGGDLEYLKNVKVECEKKGFVQSPILNEYLFLTTVNHRLHIAYIIAAKSSSGKRLANQTLRSINENQEKISGLEKILTTAANERRGGEDIVSLHTKVLEEAEKFIRAHIGEFSFRCGECNAIVQANGLPHWALIPGEYEGSPYYFVFNPELWQLVLEKKIPLAFMAFVLRTSILGIKFAVEARKEKWPEWIEFKAEEETLRVLLNEYRAEGADKQKERIEKLGL
ncbi:MAG: hypothetical protein WC450_05305 [Candidatus Omnitrophota bacterium]|jgi:hypothetical protein